MMEFFGVIFGGLLGSPRPSGARATVVPMEIHVAHLLPPRNMCIAFKKLRRDVFRFLAGPEKQIGVLGIQPRMFALSPL